RRASGLCLADSRRVPSRSGEKGVTQRTQRRIPRKPKQKVGARGICVYTRRNLFNSKINVAVLSVCLSICPLEITARSARRRRKYRFLEAHPQATNGGARRDVRVLVFAQA